MLRETHKPSEKGARVRQAAEADREGEEKEKYFQKGPGPQVEDGERTRRFDRDEVKAPTDGDRQGARR